MAFSVYMVRWTNLRGNFIITFWTSFQIIFMALVLYAPALALSQSLLTYKTIFLLKNLNHCNILSNWIKYLAISCFNWCHLHFLFICSKFVDFFALQFYSFALHSGWNESSDLDWCSSSSYYVRWYIVCHHSRLSPFFYSSHHTYIPFRCI